MQNYFFYKIRLVDIENKACIRRFVIQIIVKSRYHIDPYNLFKKRLGINE